MRWLPLLAAVGVAVSWRGGYGQDARATVAALAGLAAVGAWAWSPIEAAGASRAGVVRVLGLLALLAAASAAWTIGSAGEAIRDALAILGLAATIVVAATLRPAWGHAALLLGAATVLALTGVVAAITKSDPLALEICGNWRPAGPFEYPPTLGLVSAGALPIALALACAENRRIALAGSVTAWLLATSVALTANRTAIGLAACALIATTAAASNRNVTKGLDGLLRAGRLTRPFRVGFVSLAVVVSASASALVVGGGLGDAGAGRLLLALAFAGLGCAAVVVPVPRLTANAWIAVVAAAGIAATVGSVVADRGSGCQGDASHGRVGIWRAAVATGKERPLQGFGSGTFLAASRRHQLEERPRPTRFAHDLPLELWVELGLLGLVLAAALYLAVGRLILQALPDAALLVPMAAVFPLANLLDWPWHLLGAGMLWAVAVGGLVGAVVLPRVREERLQ